VYPFFVGVAPHVTLGCAHVDRSALTAIFPIAFATIFKVSLDILLTGVLFVVIVHALNVIVFVLVTFPGFALQPCVLNDTVYVVPAGADGLVRDLV